MKLSGAARPPGVDDAPAFASPWEACAFALVVQLHQRGVFSWPEWTRALGHELAIARERGDPDDGRDYYRHWLAALESLVAAKGLSSATELARVGDAWDRAAQRTPHGAPVELTAADYTGPA